MYPHAKIYVPVISVEMSLKVFQGSCSTNFYEFDYDRNDYFSVKFKEIKTYISIICKYLRLCKKEKKKQKNTSVIKKIEKVEKIYRFYHKLDILSSIKD